MICMAASTIFGASGRSQPIIPAAPGPGTSGKATFLTFTPGTACTTSAITWESMLQILNRFGIAMELQLEKGGGAGEQLGFSG